MPTNKPAPQACENREMWEYKGAFVKSTFSKEEEEILVRSTGWNCQTTMEMHSCKDPEGRCLEELPTARLLETVARP